MSSSATRGSCHSIAARTEADVVLLKSATEAPDRAVTGYARSIDASTGCTISLHRFLDCPRAEPTTSRARHGPGSECRKLAAFRAP